MTKVSFGGDFVAHALLEGLDVGKTTVSLSTPEEVFVQLDSEETRDFPFGDQCYFAQFVGKSVQEFLGHPAGARQPMAFRAIADAYSRKGVVRHSLVFIN